jgi:membrane-associated phospholipid phosphatase
MTLVENRPDRRLQRGVSVATRAQLLLVALLAAGGVWLTFRVLVASARGQRLDQAVMVESMQAAPAEVSRLQHLLDIVSVPSIAMALGLFTVVAVRRARPDLAVGAAVTVIGANVTTQLLKVLLERPDIGLGANNSFPSGHVTVVSSLAAAAFLVTPRRVQPAVAGAGLLAAAVAAVGTLALGWHRPSDIAGAGLVVLGWAAAVSAVLPGRLADREGVFRRTVVA